MQACESVVPIKKRRILDDSDSENNKAPLDKDQEIIKQCKELEYITGMMGPSKRQRTR